MRAPVGTTLQLSYTLGVVGLAGVAYAVRNWIHFQLAVTLPFTFLLAYWWILPESPVSNSSNFITMKNLYESFNQSINQSFDQWTKGSINQSITHFFNDKFYNFDLRFRDGCFRRGVLMIWWWLWKRLHALMESTSVRTTWNDCTVNIKRPDTLKWKHGTNVDSAWWTISFFCFKKSFRIDRNIVSRFSGATIYSIFSGRRISGRRPAWSCSTLSAITPCTTVSTSFRPIWATKSIWLFSWPRWWSCPLTPFFTSRSIGLDDVRCWCSPWCWAVYVASELRSFPPPLAISRLSSFSFPNSASLVLSSSPTW